VKEVDDSVVLEKFMSMTYRAEIIPQDQIDSIFFTGSLKISSARLTSFIDED
jgi:hypothetical protein